MVQLTKSQLKAVDSLEQSNLCLFTGGGGTGKTTTLAEWLKDTPEKVTMCLAPTGKAARRMKEAFHDSGVSMDAKTIHSGLMPERSGRDGNGWSFAYNSNNKIPCDRIIVDEFSMVGSLECGWLFSAIKPGTQLVCVGDPFQLPPVGKGCPFRDMASSGQFTHVNLTEVHRYAGRIAQVCKGIREAKSIVPSPKLNLDVNAGEFGPENYRHIERNNPPAILRTLDEVLGRVEGYGFDPKRDVQVIVTRNEAGGLSRDAVNARLQNLLNPKGRGFKDCPFRVGDKAICKKNNLRGTYSFIGEDLQRDEGMCYVANGEDGIVVEVKEKQVFVRFPDGIVSFPKFSWGKEVTLGYALTTHSSQGSGFPVTIYLVDDCRINDRTLVYTALSRAKNISFSIGQLGVLNRQIRVNQLVSRKTFLKEMLCGEIAA